MDLDQFIESTLTSIIKGVSKAEEFAKSNGARINPVPIRLLSTQGEPHYVSYGKDEGVKPLTKISFDVAVTASSSDEGKGGVGIKVLSLSASGSKSVTNVNEIVSRVKFEINVVLPYVEGSGHK